MTSSVLQEIERLGPDTVLDRLDLLDESGARALYGALASECVERSARDGRFWLKFVATRDEADPERSVKPFPTHLDYTGLLWDLLATRQQIVIAKSRQMLVSWEVCAFCVWWARFKPHQAIYWQTQQWKDAVNMVCTPEGMPAGRCQFIEANLPPWMRMKVKAQEGALSYENGSIIQAVAGGADQIRGKVGSIIVEDEFAKQQEATGVYSTIAPLIQKGARVILVGTPNGTDNMFCTLYHGRPMGTERP